MQLEKQIFRRRKLSSLPQTVDAFLGRAGIDTHTILIQYINVIIIDLIVCSHILEKLYIVI